MIHLWWSPFSLDGTPVKYPTWQPHAVSRHMQEAHPVSLCFSLRSTNRALGLVNYSSKAAPKLNVNNLDLFVLEHLVDNKALASEEANADIRSQCAQFRPNKLKNFHTCYCNVPDSQDIPYPSKRTVYCPNSFLIFHFL